MTASDPNSNRDDSIELNTVRLGIGEPPLLLLHGFTGSVLDWSEVMPSLAERREVITYDHRGHGDSPNTGDIASYTIPHLVADLEAFVETQGLDTFHLVGHSMGGVVAQLYVLANPERVLSLVLMDTMPSPSLKIPLEQLDKIVDKARASGMQSLIPRMIELARATAPLPQRDIIIANMEIKLANMDPEAYGGLAHSLAEFESVVGRLGEITCPTTVLVGELDEPFRTPSEVMADAIDGSRLVVIPAAGHCPQEDRIDVWLAEIEAHLAWATPAPA